jgi:thioredoxin reductase
MTSNHYDHIIIGAGHNDLTASISPKRRGEQKAPVFHTGLVVTDL